MTAASKGRCPATISVELSARKNPYERYLRDTATLAKLLEPRR